MKTIKVSDATNVQLDWLVAKCEDRTPSLHEYSRGQGEWFILMQTGVYRTVCAFSTEWSQMGPIIEREKIATLCPASGDFWNARKSGTHIYYEGPTPLIAAARCYVTSKLGETVEVPEEPK